METHINGTHCYDRPGQKTVKALCGKQKPFKLILWSVLDDEKRDDPRQPQPTCGGCIRELERIRRLYRYVTHHQEQDA